MLVLALNFSQWGLEGESKIWNRLGVGEFILRAKMNDNQNGSVVEF